MNGHPLFVRGIRRGLAVVLAGVLAASCVSAPKRASGEPGLACPPDEPRPPRTENVDGQGNQDWKMHHAEDGKGQDFEIWCLDAGRGADGPYHFGFAVSHPDRPRTWFGQCIFPGGQNVALVDVISGGRWQHIRLDNVDPNSPQSFPRYNDIHYGYSWLADRLTITFTQDGRPVKTFATTSPESWQDFERMLRGMRQEVAEGEASTEPAPNCRAQPLPD